MQSKNEIRTASTEAFRPHLSKNAWSRKVMRTTAVCILWWSFVRVVSSSIVWLRTLRNCWGPGANCTTYFMFVDISFDMFWQRVKIAGQSRKTFIWLHLAVAQIISKLNIGPKGSIAVCIRRRNNCKTWPDTNQSVEEKYLTEPIVKKVMKQARGCGMLWIQVPFPSLLKHCVWGDSSFRFVLWSKMLSNYCKILQGGRSS